MTYLSPIRRLKWIVFVIYFSIQISLMIVLMVKWPGYEVLYTGSDYAENVLKPVLIVSLSLTAFL